MTANSFAEAVRAVWDELIPGDDAWPSASMALGDVDGVLAALPPDTLAWLALHAPGVFNAPANERATLMRSLERTDPATFAALVNQLYDAYYNSPAAHAQVLRLAEAGPRDPCPQFDPALVETVVASRAGQRRL